MSESSERIKTCMDCGASNIPLATRCWMCQADLTHAPEFYLATAVDRPAKPVWAGNEASSWLPVGLLGGLIMLVVIGLYATEPGTIIPFAIVAAPAYLATLIRTTRKHVQGKPMGIGEMIATFAISGMAVIGILVLLAVALIVGLIAYCFVELAKH